MILATRMREKLAFELVCSIGRILVLLLAMSLAGCAGFKKVERQIATPDTFQKMPQPRLEQMSAASPFLKVHMHNGNTYVLSAWAMDSTRQFVSGQGALFNANRDTLRQGQFQIGVDSVAVFETNVLKTSGTVAALTVYTGITAAITFFCITNPKACFGSCPTFYVSDGDSLRLQAEGFSASIAPSLEATDIDALFHAAPGGAELEVEMRNEAMETHVVRHADLLAVPKAKGRRVFADLQGRFWESSAVISPVAATGSEGNCLAPLLRADGVERSSRSDSADLGEKEILELNFENVPAQSYGLVLGCRQTLLSTYLLYQTFAYMGKDAGYWLAQIERKNIKQDQNPIHKLMGGIEVLLQDFNGDWKPVAQVKEHGPLATDFHLLPLGELAGKSTKIRLRMTKGNWRLDYAALAAIARPVQVIRVQPDQVLKEGLVDKQALTLLRDSNQALTTLPGETYTLRYRMPGGSEEYELFLESRGYYLEWIRKEWIAEENPLLLAQMFLNPQAALRRLAPEFKRVEAEMENHFWRSRYAKP